jgi:uncharacterized protein
VIYLDASAIVKLVVEEAETEALRTWLGRRRSPRVTSDITRVELARACMRAEPAALLEAQRTVARLNTMPVSKKVLVRAAAFQPAELRSLDAIHLASALELRPHLRALVAYDARLVEAARAARLPIECPT